MHRCTTCSFCGGCHGCGMNYRDHDDIREDMKREVEKGEPKEDVAD